MSIKDSGPMPGVIITMEIDPEHKRDEIQYAVLVFVYGDQTYPFKEQEKITMRNLIAQNVHDNLLTGQTAEVLTMDSVAQK